MLYDELLDAELDKSSQIIALTEKKKERKGFICVAAAEKFEKTEFG